jgi:hypothetical protein
MNDKTDEEIAEEIETKATVRALGLLQTLTDSASSAKRIQALARATAEHNAARDAAEKLVAEADSKAAAAEAASASLAQRTKEFQTWVDSTEKAYRAREDRIRVNEESQTARDRKLAVAEDDFARRRQAHEQRVASLKESLA